MSCRLILACVACCCAGLAGGVAAAQEGSEAAPGQDQTSSASFDEEVVVRGQSRARLRFEIQRAEEAVYDRFNAINSTDDFDIHCRLAPVTGSKMLRRLCEANFWREGERHIGEETVRGLQGTPGPPPSVFRAQQYYKRTLMYDEMRTLAGEDEEFRQSLMRLGNLKRLLADSPNAEPSPQTGARELSADDGELPYDAEYVAVVHIAHDPWSHPLTLRTFTLGEVTGEIRSLEVHCDDRSERLHYEADVEWTLPEGWGDCTVVVDGKRDTTFSLYEFQ